MSNQNLFLPICGTFLILLILLAAIFGMRSRLRFANQLRKVYKDKEKTENWLTTHKKKQRLLLLLALISVVGMLMLGFLIASGLLLPSKILLIAFVILISLSIISGTLMLIDLENLRK